MMRQYILLYIGWYEGLQKSVKRTYMAASEAKTYSKIWDRGAYVRNPAGHGSKAMLGTSVSRFKAGKIQKVIKRAKHQPR